MTIIAFVLGLVLGVCAYAIARWAEYFLDVRQSGTERCDE